MHSSRTRNEFFISSHSFLPQIVLMNDSSSITFGACAPDVIPNERLAAYVIVHDNQGRVAAVQADVRGRDELWLPGGGMLEHETPEEAVVREVREELGRDLLIRCRLESAIQYFYQGDRGAWCKMTAHFFLGELHGPPITPHEHELLWVDPTEHKADFFHACHVWAASQATNK